MPHWLADALTRYGYIALFAGVFLENLGIPVPGETVLLAAGFFCRENLLRLGIVIPCATVAAICGDNFGYWIGRRGGKKFVDRYGRFVGLTPKRITAVEKYFRRHGPRTIFFARFISGLRVVAAIFAGISRIRWPVFFLFNAAGAVVWSVAVASLGYAFGRSWKTLEHWVGRTGVVVAVAVVVVIALMVAYRRRTGASHSAGGGHGKR